MRRCRACIAESRRRRGRGIRPPWSAISPADRALIIGLRWAGYTSREISARVGRHPSTIDKTWAAFRRAAAEVDERPVVADDGQRYAVVWHGAARGAGVDQAKMALRATHAARMG